MCCLGLEGEQDKLDCGRVKLDESVGRRLLQERSLEEKEKNVEWMHFSFFDFLSAELCSALIIQKRSPAGSQWK